MTGDFRLTVAAMTGRVAGTSTRPLAVNDANDRRVSMTGAEMCRRNDDGDDNDGSATYCCQYHIMVVAVSIGCSEFRRNDGKQWWRALATG